MNDDQVDEFNDPSFNEDDTSETPPFDVVAYNELRSCADLVRMTNDGIIDLHPDFQRDVVWNLADRSRFIDSLIKHLPIPSMCFALDYKTDTWIVIDGLQRMTSIVNFLNGGDWKLSKLDEIDKRISGKHASAFLNAEGDFKKVFDRVQNKTVPITVLRCDLNKKNHMEYLFTIFHRLNAGGAKINNQEIRNCIYSGSFNNLLKELDETPAWRKYNLMVEGNKYRYVKQEIILRFFSFADGLEKYSGKLGKFLNEYMHKNRNANADFLNEKRDLFLRVTSILDSKIFPKRLKKRLPTSVSEALLVGLAINIDFVERQSTQALQQRFNELRASETFSEKKLSEGLAQKAKVTERIAEAINIFSK